MTPACGRPSRLSRRTFLGGLVALGACRSGPGNTLVTTPTSATTSATTPTGSPGSPGPPGAGGPIATATVGAGGAGSAEPAVAPPTPPLGAAPFALGVASGDPLANAVVLWTRLIPKSPVGDDISVAWDVAADAAFDDLIASGTAVARAAEAHTVHLDVVGLQPATRYFYRFRTPEVTSPVGRTNTAPAPGRPVERLRMAAASCQNYEDGFYAAYGDLARQDVDVVTFLGDYIYEGGPHSGGARRNTGPDPVDLDGYRRRYAQVKADPNLQLAHQAAPWVVTWDDHEVVNNYAGALASGADDTDAARSALLARRAAAYRAWWEHQPVRLPPPEGPDLRIYRSVAWGDLARFVVLDGRQYRSDQPCGDGVGAPCPERDRNDATMLGPEQEAWVAAEFATTKTEHTIWTMLANQTILTDAVVRLGASSVVLFDQWDGYPAARRRLLDAASRAGVDNLVALTGDIHAAMVGTLSLDGRAVGTEFVATSISSTFSREVASTFELGMALVPNVSFTDTSHRGYVLCDITATELRATFRFVDDARTADSPVRPGPSWVVRAGTPGAKRQ